jgi:hypothetical protein
MAASIATAVATAPAPTDGTPTGELITSLRLPGNNAAIAAAAAL